MYILILYYSRYGATARMAHYMANGVEAVKGIGALVRTVPPLLSSQTNLQSQERSDQDQSDLPTSGSPYASLDDLKNCAGLAMGSPTRFGLMASPLKYFIDSTGSLWMSGQLTNKPAAVFTSAGHLHGGQESTLLSMMLPLLHHGMLMVGMPSGIGEPGNQAMGNPYGTSHTAGETSQNPVSHDEKALCQSLGHRLAIIAKQLNCIDSRAE